jgi:hypothetical protein
MRATNSTALGELGWATVSKREAHGERGSWPLCGGDDQQTHFILAAEWGGSANIGVGAILATAQAPALHAGWPLQLNWPEETGRLSAASASRLNVLLALFVLLGVRRITGEAVGQEVAEDHRLHAQRVERSGQPRHIRLRRMDSPITETALEQAQLRLRGVHVGPRVSLHPLPHRTGLTNCLHRVHCTHGAAFSGMRARRALRQTILAALAQTTKQAEHCLGSKMYARVYARG